MGKFTKYLKRVKRLRPRKESWQDAVLCHFSGHENRTKAYENTRMRQGGMEYYSGDKDDKVEEMKYKKKLKKEYFENFYFR